MTADRRCSVIAHHTPKYQCRPIRMTNQSVVARITVRMQLLSVIAAFFAVGGSP